MSRSIMYGSSSGSGGDTYIKATATTYTTLPDASNYSDDDLALVYNGEQELISSVLSPWTAPKYKYPAGLYIVRAGAWVFYQTQTINAMNSIILDITSDWAALIATTPVFKISAMINYEGTVYKNLTGTYSTTAPDLDSTNWVSMIVLAEPRTPVQLKSTSLLDQTITSAVDGVVVLTEVVQESNGVTVSNGEITFSKAGFYRIQMQLNISNQNNTELETWAESFNGSTWDIISNSGNVKDTATANTTNFLIESTFVVPADFTIRIKARVSTGAGTLDYSTLDNGIGVPSVTILAYELDPRVFGINIDTANLTEPLYIGSGVNATKFELDGTMVSEGEATTWDEVSNSLIGNRIDVSQGRIDYNFDELTIDFAENARYPEEPIAVVSQMQHARKLNTEIRPHLHWIQNQNVMPNILIEYRASNNGAQVPITFTQKALTSTDNVFTYTSGEIQQITEFNLPSSIGEGLNLSGTFECRIYRDSANTSGLFAGADAYSGLLSVKYFDIHMIKDMNGSREEFVK